MPNNKISPDLFSSASDVRRRTTAPRPSLAARVTALLRAHHLDRQLAVGVPAAAGSALAVHQVRLTSVAERLSGGGRRSRWKRGLGRSCCLAWSSISNCLSRLDILLTTKNVTVVMVTSQVDIPVTHG